MEKIQLAFISIILAHAFGIERSNDSLKFFLLGDWGGLPFWPYRTPIQMGVSQMMAELATDLQVDFVVSLGDNFYLSGVKDDQDRRFNETFVRAFSANSLQIPWYILAGNHDHYGNVSAQLDYTNLSERWVYPDLYYKKSFRIPSSKAILDVLMLDTVLLCGNTRPDNEEGPQPVLDQQDIPESERQWLWLEENLNSSKANYLLVCGHFPVYSIGLHGNTDCLVQRLVPLLEKNHVNAYISGHDHNIQHIQPRDTPWTVNYFVVGTGNFIDPSKKNADRIPKDSLLFHWSNIFSFGAVAYVEVTENNMTVLVFGSSHKILYSHTLQPRF